MDKLEEKIESLEQVIEALIGRCRNIEIVVGSLAEIEPNDYGETLQSIVELLRRAEQKANLDELKNAISQLGRKIELSSKKSETIHHHHLDIKSRSRLWWLLAIFITVSTSLGSCISMLIRNHQLAADAEKYGVVRAFYPQQSKQLDEAYQHNRKVLMSAADSLLRLPQPKTKKKK